jgi:hypothetical protein
MVRSSGWMIFYEPPELCSEMLEYLILCAEFMILFPRPWPTYWILQQHINGVKIFSLRETNFYRISSWQILNSLKITKLYTGTLLNLDTTGLYNNNVIILCQSSILQIVISFHKFILIDINLKCAIIIIIIIIIINVSQYLATGNENACVWYKIKIFFQNNYKALKDHNNIYGNRISTNPTIFNINVQL